MGTWGTSLYSSDSSKDFETTIKSIIRLPFNDEEIYDIISEEFKEIIANENEEDHYIFWLVLADQFNKYGITNDLIFQKAIDIIDFEKDLNRNKELGMDNISLKARDKILKKFKESLLNRNSSKNRKLLKKPEELIFKQGDIIKFPIVKNGSALNPYFSKNLIMKHPDQNETIGFGYAIIISSKLVFEYLASYWLIVNDLSFDSENNISVENLLSEKKWLLTHAGVCSKSHFNKMKIQIIGNCQFSHAINEFTDEEYRFLKYAAVNDISLANSLRVNQREKILKKIISLLY
jgi:hypothetical protein